MRAPHIMNPDHTTAGGTAGGGYYPVGVHSQTTQAYLQQGPVAASGSHQYQQQQKQQQQYYNSGGAPLPSDARTGIPDALRAGGGSQPHHHHTHAPSASVSTTASAPVRAGSAVVVHQDGGRVVMRKGERVDEEREEPLEEIPPTYDSLVQGSSPGGE